MDMYLPIKMIGSELEILEFIQALSCSSRIMESIMSYSEQIFAQAYKARVSIISFLHYS